jgi:RHS repeat-associated protein
MELNSSGAIQAMNGYGPTGWVARDYPAGSSLASTFGAQDYSFTYDPEGNLVQRHPEISAGADALDTNLYDGFGAQIADIDAATGTAETRIDPVGFGGEYGYYFDKETGKSLLGHRYYDSAYGRFLNRDPIGYKGGINLYGYAGNNPVNESDPSGFDPTPKGFVRVGRWMCDDEYKKMLESGLVQPSKSNGGADISQAASDPSGGPPSQSAYRNMEPGDVFVEFDVPEKNVRQGGMNSACCKIYGSNSRINVPLAARGEGLEPGMPVAKNIEITAHTVPRTRIVVQGPPNAANDAKALDADRKLMQKRLLAKMSPAEQAEEKAQTLQEEEQLEQAVEQQEEERDLMKALSAAETAGDDE